MEKSPNWLEMPHDLMADILQRLRTAEILNNAWNVCTTWRRICKDPAMWKVINVAKYVDNMHGYYDLERLTKKAVDLSCGELISIRLQDFGTDELLDHIVLCSSKLKCLWLISCDNITDRGLSQAVKRVPQLEALRHSFISTDAKDIEVIGQNCPQLKSFMMEIEYTGLFIDCDDNALAIAKNMPELTHLKVVDSRMTNDGLEAILNGCPHLQSLDVRWCNNLDLDLGVDLVKQCMERIKDFKFRLEVEEDYGYFDESLCYADVDDFSDYSD